MILIGNCCEMKEMKRISQRCYKLVEANGVPNIFADARDSIASALRKEPLK